MKKVYLLYVKDVSYSELVGVFDTEESAKEFYDIGYKQYTHPWQPRIVEKILNQGFSIPMHNRDLDAFINIKIKSNELLNPTSKTRS